MPTSIFLIPGVGAQGGDARGPRRRRWARIPASILVAASRSIAGAEDPGAAAEALRAELWGLSGS